MDALNVGQNGYEYISADDGSTSFTSDEESAIINTFDRKVVLFVGALYMLSFLDRSNIGNARVAGICADLRLDDAQFEWLLRAFYLTYIAFEWMTLLWRVFPAHLYLTACVLSWGCIASAQSLSTGFWSMLFLRACLGIGEAAFVGIPFYLSFFYKPKELAFRTGLFISAAPLATSFAGTLAWAITRFGNSVPIASWRLLFLIEGFPSIIVSAFVYLHIPDSPGSARFLTPRQRQVAKIRLRGVDHEEQALNWQRLNWHDCLQTILDPRTYVTALMFFASNIAFASMPVFLPTIISEMGHSGASSQALSVPPYLIAFFTVVSTAWASDRLQSRGAFVISFALIAAAGYLWLAIAGYLAASPSIRYVGVFPATAGFFTVVTIVITWTLNNQESTTGKGTGLAILNYIGQLGPLVGVHLYPDAERPYYVKGMSICAVCMVSVAILATFLRIDLARRNLVMNRTAKRTRTVESLQDRSNTFTTSRLERFSPYIL